MHIAVDIFVWTLKTKPFVVYIKIYSSTPRWMVSCCIVYVLHKLNWVLNHTSKDSATSYNKLISETCLFIHREPSKFFTFFVVVWSRMQFICISMKTKNKKTFANTKFMCTFIKSLHSLTVYFVDIYFSLINSTSLWIFYCFMHFMIYEMAKDYFVVSCNSF